MMPSWRFADGVDIDPATGAVSGDVLDVHLEDIYVKALLEHPDTSNCLSAVTALARFGMAYVNPRADGYIHFTDLAVRLFGQWQAWNQRGSGSFFDRLWSGHGSREQAISWLRSMFMFTKAANIHTGAMLSGAQARNEDLAKWQELYDEEIHHWKMYRRAFEEVGISIETELAKEVRGTVALFVSDLVEAANQTQADYGALLLPIEQPPESTRLDDDKVFGCLVSHYGFSRDAIMPLFRHSHLNAEIGHCSLWFDALAATTWYTPEHCHRILGRAARHLQHHDGWACDVEACLYR